MSVSSSVQLDRISPSVRDIEGIKGDNGVRLKCLAHGENVLLVTCSSAQDAGVRRPASWF